MKKLVIVALAALCLGRSAPAATVVYNAAATGSSSAYSVDGASRVYLQVEAESGAADAVVVIEQRMGASTSWQTIRTITDPAAGDVAYGLEPVGEVRVRVTTWTSGMVIATLTARDYAGRGMW